VPEAFITTSWDDGCAEDFRIAELLSKYSVPGCFYVPRSNPERAVISESEIKQLGSGFELGGHTLGHHPLTSLSRDEARREIHDGKRWLDDLTGVATQSFCYPQGKFTGTHARDVADAGFLGARTADWMCLAPGADVYRIAPSLHLYPHTLAVHIAHCLRRGHPRELVRHVVRFGAKTQPSQLADAMLDHIEEYGGVFHLWGHGWEIAESGMWDELATILKSIAGRPALCKLDNAALAARLRGASVATP
jgi:peptidoglycan-N-acetylglucosamine deacetylase